MSVGSQSALRTDANAWTCAKCSICSEMPAVSDAGASGETADTGSALAKTEWAAGGAVLAMSAEGCLRSEKRGPDERSC